MLLSTALLFSLAAPLSFAAPAANVLTKRVSDAPYSVSAATVQKAITCPNGIQKKKGGIVYLIHGTGSTGSESWANGPYNEILPKAGKGYDVCWSKYLAPKSATGKVAIIGHSQGAGLNPQWALVFWPSIQKLVSNYIALAPDWHGTIESLALCAAEQCEPSVWQQTVGSHYLAAQNSQLPGGGGQALVPTSAIYTLTDDVIQPETPPLGPTSYLKGAGVHALQDLDICGPAHVADHFSMIVDPAAFGLALTALEYGGPVNLAKFDRTYCTYIKDDVLFNPRNTAALLRSAVADAIAVGTGMRSPAEPPLQPYVCQRGFATNCGPAF